MSVRRKVFIVLSAAGCAFVIAIAMPAEAPGLSRIESAAPPYFEAWGQDTFAADDDGPMIELRHRARFALTQLQDQDRR